MGIVKNSLFDFEWWLQEKGIPAVENDEFDLTAPGIRYLWEVYVEEQTTGKIDNTIKVMKLTEAMVQEGQDHHKIRIKYVKRNGDIEDYEILPLDISDNICYALDTVVNDLKEFNLDRITEIVNVEEKGE